MAAVAVTKADRFCRSALRTCVEQLLLQLSSSGDIEYTDLTIYVYICKLILEFYTPGVPDSGWVHVSYKTEGNRKSILTAMKEDGKTVYKPNLIQ